MHSPGQNMIHWSLVYTLGSLIMIIPVSTEDREFLNRLTNYYPYSYSYNFSLF
jgi:hypothetical protein